MLAVILSKRDFGPMLAKEREAEEKGRALDRAKQETNETTHKETLVSPTHDLREDSTSVSDQIVIPTKLISTSVRAHHISLRSLPRTECSISVLSAGML